MTKTKIERLKAIKEEFVKTQARLVAARQLEESAESAHLSTLLENDLEQAELVLAAQDIMNKLQNISEDLAKMNAQDLFPLVDRMKATFGPEASHAFEVSAGEAVTNAMQTVRHAKDELGSAIMRLEGKYPNDMSMDTPPVDGAPTDMELDSAPADGAPEASMDDVSAAMDDFGGADAAAGPNPLGRARKESVEATKAPLKESVILESAGKKLLETEGLGSLIDWLLNEAASSMPADKFRSFSKSVAVRAAEDPAKLAGWIGKKKHGMAAMAQLAQPTYTASPDLSVVESIEEGKTFRKNSDDEDKAGRFAARKDARKKKADDLEEGKTFKRSPEDEDEDVDNWGKKHDAKDRKAARKAKGADVSESHKFIASKIAEMIEFNIQATGKGNTAKVLEMFSDTFADVATLNEGDGSDLTISDIFESVYGMKPTQYSVTKLREFMAPLNTNDKKVAAGAMAKLASNMAQDKSAAGRPVTSALGQLSGQERAVAQKMIQGMKADGTNPKNLGDFTTGASSMIDGGDDDQDQNGMGSQNPNQVQENINAAHWPTDSAGQYKGEPMQTDYGKLKPLTGTPKGESTSSDDDTSSAPAPKAAKPKKEKTDGGNPFAKKEETAEPADESDDDSEK